MQERQYREQGAAVAREEQSHRQDMEEIVEQIAELAKKRDAIPLEQQELRSAIDYESSKLAQRNSRKWWNTYPSQFNIMHH